MKKNTINIFITIPVGQSIRDFLILDTVKQIKKGLPEANIVLLSPAYNILEFKKLCDENRVVSRRTEIPVNVKPNGRLLSLRNRIKNKKIKNFILNREVDSYNVPQYLNDVFKEFPPSLVVFTHPMTSHDYPIFIKSKKEKVLTLGVIKSWDNLRKKIALQVDKIAVWNEINYKEAIQYNSYNEKDIDILGPISFDPFFCNSWFDSKEKFFESLNFDISKPLLTYATSGVYNLEFYERDETHILDDILGIIDRNDVLRDTQILIRLHPVSRYENFAKYLNLPINIRVSYGQYMKTIGWYTDKFGYKEQLNILKHSDVVVTPGSSWTIESAILNTPVIVPVYSNIQPDHARAQFDNYTLAKHFKPIYDNKWVPITRSLKDTEKELLTAIEFPDKNKNGREQLVNNYVYFKDGKSSKRVADWILKNLKKH